MWMWASYGIITFRAIKWAMVFIIIYRFNRPIPLNHWGDFWIVMVSIAVGIVEEAGSRADRRRRE
jgi:hypothetical protein